MFGKEIETLRDKAGLSQAELAKAIGVTQTQISRFEKGKRDPSGMSADVYLKLCKALSVGPYHFEPFMAGGVPVATPKKRGRAKKK